MNYRHVYHAGNFADVLKHATLGQLLSACGQGAGPLAIIDTHAGAGLYDLRDPAARRSGESEAGIGRLMADAGAPEVFDVLKTAVAAVNPPQELRYYPGSPLLIARWMGPADRLTACEARADDQRALERSLKSDRRVRTLLGDGWVLAGQAIPPAPARVLVLVDPPYERGDDRQRCLDLLARTLRVNPAAVFAIWLPIKDLDGYDSFVGDVEDAARRRDVLTAEVRLRPLTNPMMLNGCAMVIVNPPEGLQARLTPATEYVACASGEAGGKGEVRLKNALR